MFPEISSQDWHWPLFLKLRFPNSRESLLPILLQYIMEQGRLMKQILLCKSHVSDFSTVVCVYTLYFCFIFTAVSDCQVLSGAKAHYLEQMPMCRTPWQDMRASRCSTHGGLEFQLQERGRCQVRIHVLDACLWALCVQGADSMGVRVVASSEKETKKEILGFSPVPRTRENWVC